MKITIDASRAFLKNRTGIEEYAYQVIGHLRDKLGNHEVVLYVRKTQNSKIITQEKNLKSKNDINSKINNINIDIPRNWKIKLIPYGYLWTQIGLAWQMLVDSPDVLFVPAHTIPVIHPKNTFVVVHGLEYERCPDSYSFFSRLIHRLFVKKSCHWAKKIISVSENTKKDLINMYKVPSEKIKVIYNGYDNPNYKLQDASDKKIQNSYLLFIGRLEKRKNVEGIVKAFELMKEKYNYSGKLVLAGRPRHGYDQIKFKIESSKFKADIVEPGYVGQDEKWKLLENADVFLFPSLCEGFGIPILEAQSVGVPVVTSDFGPMDEVAGNPKILVDPNDPEKITELIQQLIQDTAFRRQTIQKGHKNVKRFSWEKSAGEIAGLINCHK